MGRSVSYPSGAIVAYRAIPDAEDESWDWAYEDMVDFVTYNAQQAFPSLEEHDGWRGREDRILLRNAYADLGISVYGSLAAVWLAEREDASYMDSDMECARSGRAAHWLQQVKRRFESIFAEYRRIGRFSNGEAIYKPFDAV